MKTCVILEINDGKAIVLYPDGEITEVKAKSDWKVGQTVTPKTGTRTVKPLFVAVACILLVFAAITPLAVGYLNSSDDDFVDGMNVAAIGEPTVEASSIGTANDDYSNVFEVIDNATGYYSDYAVEPLAESAESSASESQELQKIEPQEKMIAGDEVNSEETTEFSGTNIQVEGIQEADIIKTDGKYIYALNSKNLVVLLANDGNPKVVSKIKQNENKGKFSEMYLEGNRLITIRNVNASDGDSITKVTTEIVIFDVSSPDSPEVQSTLSQSGRYSDSRMADGYLYLISQHSPNTNNIEKSEPITYLPEYDNGSEKMIAEPEDITICPVNNLPSYIVLGSVDIFRPDDFVGTKNILGKNGDVYVSAENIYITAESDDFIETKEKGIKVNSNGTQLTKLSYSKGSFGKVKTSVIPGSVSGQFFMDEYDGTFRVVTEVYWDGTATRAPKGYNYEYYDGEYYLYGSYTALFTLDGNLKQLGKIVDIAPGESLYSCRFMGDYAYFVTFEQVDPLFTADLKDPKNPKLAGELKIPGFSEYLHPYTDGLLFGLGSDADEDTGTVGSLKLSMFDNSNPKKIKEQHTMILDGYDYTEAANNHKAILVDSGKKLIAFPSGGVYLVFTYDEKDGFKQIGKMSYGGDYKYEYSENVIRGLYINDSFYVITPNRVSTFDMNDDFKALKNLTINSGAEPVYDDAGLEEIIVFD